jgi:hypothetical protein
LTHKFFERDMESREESPRPDVRAKDTTAAPKPLKQILLVPEKANLKPFTDHRGQKGVSAYWGRPLSPGAPVLPPLWSFQFYVTFGATADSDPDLPAQICEATLRSISDRYPMRLDFNFLPDADPEKCMEHYCAETAARQEAGARLLVTDPHGDAGVLFSFLLMIEHADWESKGATTVSFNQRGPDGPGRVEVIRGFEWGNKSNSHDDNDKEFVGQVLHSLRGGTDAWNEGLDLYDEKLAQGRSDWD